MLKCHEHYIVQEIRSGRMRVRQKLSKPFQTKFSCFTKFSFFILLFISNVTYGMFVLYRRTDFNSSSAETADVPEIFLEWLLEKKQTTDYW
jgi:hypothetical protein